MNNVSCFNHVSLIINSGLLCCNIKPLTFSSFVLFHPFLFLQLLCCSFSLFSFSSAVVFFFFTVFFSLAVVLFFFTVFFFFRCCVVLIYCLLFSFLLFNRYFIASVARSQCFDLLMLCSFYPILLSLFLLLFS